MHGADWSTATVAMRSRPLDEQAPAAHRVLGFQRLIAGVAEVQLQGLPAGFTPKVES